MKASNTPDDVHNKASCGKGKQPENLNNIMMVPMKNAKNEFTKSRLLKSENIFIS